MKRLAAFLLTLALLLSLTGCSLEDWLDSLTGGTSSVSSASVSGASSGAEGSALSPDAPRPGGLRLEMTGEEEQAASFAASAVPGDPDFPMPDFTDFSELQIMEPELLCTWLSRAAGWLSAKGGRVNDPASREGADPAELALWPSARFYTLSVCEQYLRSIFGPEVSPDWAYLSENDNRVLPNSGLFAVSDSPAEQSDVTLHSQPVGFEPYGDGWVFQLAVCALTGSDSDGTPLSAADWVSGKTLGSLNDVSGVSEIIWENVTQFSYLYVTVLPDADGNLYIAGVER